MPDTELDASIKLQAAKLRRRYPKISKRAARAISAKMHFIVACVREHLKYQTDTHTGVADPHSLEETILHAATEAFLGDPNTAADHGGDYFDSLYSRCMLLCDQTCGTNLVGQFDLEKNVTARIPRPQ